MKVDRKKYYLGFDFGGTNIKYLIRQGKEILLQDSIKTEELKTSNEFLEKIFNLIKKAITNFGFENIGGIGIGSKGRIMKDNSIKSASCPILNNLNLVEILEEKYDIQTKVLNDASVPYFAIEKDLEDKIVLIVTLGTGLGTGLFINGRGFESENFSSNFASKRFKDSVNEDYASKRFLVKRAKLSKLKAQTPKELFEMAKSEDNFAIKIFKEFGKNLGEILSPLIEKYEVEEVYFSGGVSKSWKFFSKDLKLSVNKFSKKIPEIHLIQTEYEVGAYGASKLFEEKK